MTATRPAERDIYQEMWGRPEYRAVAPGAACALTFVEQARPAPGARVIDFGCGTGRGGAMLSAMGMDVTLVDFTTNSIDPEIRGMLPFVEADLTKPIPIRAEYGFCTDVLEHIPPEDVGAVLNNILMAAQHVFFQISTVDDVLGALIGHPLHLSVHPYSWWLDQFKARDCAVHWSRDTLGACMFYVTAWRDGQEVVDIGVLNAGEETIKANVEQNVQGGWKQATPFETNDMEVMILGGGPSMPEQIDHIKALHAAGVRIVTLNGAYNWALEHGLTPSATVIVDARPFNARFVQPVIDHCMYFIASQCDPAVYAGLPKDRTYQWHTSAECIRELCDAHLPRWYGIPGGSTVLLRAIPLFRMLGFHKFHLFGCDSCLSETEAHHAYAQPENNEQIIVPVSVGGRMFHCHPWMASQAQEFISLIRVLGSEFDCIIYGDGLLKHIVDTGASLSLEEGE